MYELYEQLARVAKQRDMPVLVTGETGVGKEHVCRMIHDCSPRSGEPLVVVNCAELDRNLLRSELFGHERGAFTGCSERHRGLFEMARRGTLLLDEVSEMPNDVQAFFLRVLETGQFRRLGGTAEVDTDVRIVAATNRNLERRVSQKLFREDLLYRINNIELRVPPLRERADDVRDLAETFCSRIAAAQRITAYLTEEAHASLLLYEWPGNVRELKSVIERTVIIHGPGRITAGDLRMRPRPDSGQLPEAVRGMDRLNILKLAQIERGHICQTLDICGGNRTRAAKLLGVARSTLVRKLSGMKSQPAPE